MAAKRIAGTCFVKVDGEQLELSGSLAFPLNDVQRTTLTSAAGTVVGYSEITQVPYVSGTFFVKNDFPVETLKSSTSMTVTAECANGMVYTLSEAYLAGDSIEYSPQDGTVTLKWEGTRGELS